jgi:hypothetical protein
MPYLTPQTEHDYGPWPPVEPCRKDGHDWGGLGPGRVVPFPAEGNTQTCSVCGCQRYTEFGQIHYRVPRAFLQAAYEARKDAP